MRTLEKKTLSDDPSNRGNIRNDEWDEEEYNSEVSSLSESVSNEWLLFNFIFIYDILY